LPRAATDDQRSSRESIARDEVRGFDRRTETEQRRARDGQKARELPLAAAPGTEPVPRHGVDGPPAEQGELAVGTPAPARATGVVDPTPRDALLDVGRRATEAEVRGPTADDVDSSAASNERDPMPFDLTRPSAGGAAGGTGVAGARPAPGVSARSRRDQGGSAAMRAPLWRGPGDPATRAAAQDAYFRKMASRLDKLVKIPPDLRRELEPATVIVKFRLQADGSVADVMVTKTSGFADYDDEVTAALRRGAPYGRVPALVLAGRPSIVVSIPYSVPIGLLN
jgi:TonB family protein